MDALGIAEYRKKYREEHREELRLHDHLRNRTNRKRQMQKTYYNMKMRTLGKGLYESGAKGKPILTFEEFWNFYQETKDIYETMYKNWLDSGEDHCLSPSIDRIESDKGYEIGNLQWLTHAVNSAKGNRDINNREPEEVN